MKPADERQLADAIAGANGPLRIRGGGTRGLAVAGDVLETGALSGIRLYEPGALTMVAGAGTPVSEIEAALSAEGQMLAFEPLDLAEMTGASGASTIGGVFATNASGPRRVQAGAARDFLLGVRFVDGSGNIVKNGGRVMKNVTGYDLVKLMAGSCGTLGVLTEVSFKVMPRPETRACILIDGLDDETALAAMASALGSPFEVTGAAHTPSGIDGHPVTMIRIEGFEGSVAYRAERLTERLATFGPVRVETDPARVAEGWRWMRDAQGLRDGDIWRLSCRPSDAARLAGKSGATARLYDWGGGRLWLVMPPGTDLRAQLGPFDGHATIIRSARTDLPRFHPEPPHVARLTAGLRARFDPRGILNAGLMG